MILGSHAGRPPERIRPPPHRAPRGLRPPRLPRRPAGRGRGGDLGPRRGGAAPDRRGQVALLPGAGDHAAAAGPGHDPRDLPADRADAGPGRRALLAGDHRPGAEQRAGRARAARGGRHARAGRARSALRLARARRAAELPPAARAVEDRAHRRRRGALPEPVGARLPPRVPPAERAPAAHRRAGDRAHRDRHAPGARRDRPPARAARPGPGARRLPPPEPDLLGEGAPLRRRPHRGAARGLRGGRAAPHRRHRPGDRLLRHPEEDRGGRGGAQERGLLRRPLPRRPHRARPRPGEGRVRRRQVPDPRRHERVRDGDRLPRRPADRALLGPRQPRGLLPGGGPGRARRAPLRVRALLRPRRPRHPAAAPVRSDRGPRGPPGGRPRRGRALRHLGVRLPPAAALRALHRHRRPPALRALRRLLRGGRGAGRAARAEAGGRAPRGRALEDRRGRRSAPAPGRKAEPRAGAPGRKVARAEEGPARRPRRVRRARRPPRGRDRRRDRRAPRPRHAREARAEVPDGLAQGPPALGGAQEPGRVRSPRPHPPLALVTRLRARELPEEDGPAAQVEDVHGLPAEDDRARSQRPSRRAARRSRRSRAWGRRRSIASETTCSRSSASTERAARAARSSPTASPRRSRAGRRR